jgi:DNA polymerase
VIVARIEPLFSSWREKARELLAARVEPGEVLWSIGAQDVLFETTMPSIIDRVRVPREFVDLAAMVAWHRDEWKWALLYRVLFRLAFDEPQLLEIVTDDDVRQLASMRTQVGHDMHRMKAFVRFREIDGRYAAWYEPDHLIVEAVAPFFAQRFGSMEWSILTPDRCAHWDMRELRFSAGVARSAAPVGDPLEDLWRAYYRSTFNPARVNVNLLRSHIPTRKWGVLPEAEVIAELVRGANGNDIARTQASAADFIPPGATLPVLREAIRSCRGCELHECATQPVFGVGPEDAPLMFVGEQPGDNEDREGKPFIGPAGQLFDMALADAGLSREEVYLTGAVKHFRYEERGKRRIHKTASRAQVAACQPWLAREIEIVRPKLIVCMGNTAVLSVVGRGVRLLEERGRVMPHRVAEGVMATVHPGFLLRMPDEARKAAEYGKFVADLRFAREWAISAAAGSEGPRDRVA